MTSVTKKGGEVGGWGRGRIGRKFWGILSAFWSIFDDFEGIFREPEKVGGAVTLDSGRRPEKKKAMGADIAAARAVLGPCLERCGTGGGSSREMTTSSWYFLIY